MNETRPYFPVVVIGAGAAGLRAAFDLADLGLAPLVVEKGERAGGRLLELERWFSQDACGLCRLLDSERRPVRPGDGRDILCLRHAVAKAGPVLKTRCAPVEARRQGTGFTLALAEDGARSEVDCDSVVVASGLEETDPGYLTHLRAGLDPDVVAATRFEEMIARPSPRPPRRPSDGREIRRIAFIGCAGSRDTRHPWCSASCCSFLAKEIRLLRDLDPGIETSLMVMDLRLFAKGMTLYGDRALDGTRILRGKAASIERTRGGSLRVRAASDAAMEDIEVDLAVLSGGVRPSAGGLFPLLGVETDDAGFPLPGGGWTPCATSDPAVFAAGSCRNPCDISTSVIEGRSAAAAAFELVRKKSGGGADRGPGRVLVVGGGIAGMLAARTLAVTGCGVTLLEKDTETGGIGRLVRLDAAGRDLPAMLGSLEAELASMDGVEILRGVEATAVHGRSGCFSAGTAGGELRGFDAVVVATGGALHRDGSIDGRTILGLHDLERRLASGDPPQGDVVFIQCTGSRDALHPYCNRVCCASAAALATRIARSGARAWILYRDIVTPGLDEHLYEEARSAGVIFVRFEASRPPAVRSGGGGAVVEVLDGTLGRTLILKPALVVLSSGVEAPRDALDRLLVPAGEDGFAAEDDSRFRPCQSTRPGVYVAGNARSPSAGMDAAASGICAAVGASILARLVREGAAAAAPSRTKGMLCTGCGVCVSVCPAGARILDGAVEATARVLEPHCQACGLCEASCPSGAAVVDEDHVA